MIKKIIYLFLTWRIFLFTPLVVSQLFLLPRKDYGYTFLTHFIEKGSALSNFLLYPFGNFDGVYYLMIASGGYTVNAGFFPLFPLSIHILTLPFNIQSFSVTQYFFANILIGFYFLCALIIFYKLLKIDYKQNIASNAMLLLLIFPTSFFFASIYSESLFFLLSVLSFYLARKKNWLLASFFGGLLSATRLVGIAMFPSLLYEYFKNEKNKTIGKFLLICLSPLGLIVYAFYNFLKWGNPFYFVQAQGNLQNNRSVNSIILPTQTLFRYLKILISVSPKIYEWWVAFFELSFFVFTITILYIAWRKKVRTSYLLFGLICLITPLLTGTLSGIPRYVLIIFPIYITLALIKNKSFKIIYCMISAVLLFVFFMLFSKGYFIS